MNKLELQYTLIKCMEQLLFENWDEPIINNHLDGWSTLIDLSNGKRLQINIEPWENEVL